MGSAIPNSPGPPQALSPAKLYEQVLAAFPDRIPRSRVSPVYRLGLLLVAVTMVLLPLAYVGLIGLAIYGLYFHATKDLGVLTTGSGSRISKSGILVYLGPLVVGAILVLFMIKPLFAPRRESQRPKRLDPGEAPLLFALVEKLCKSMGAPVPREVHVDCQVNASASFRRGFLSFLGNDLVLTIGLPLAVGLSLKEFTGVLAHEFGHFAQGAGMRLTYVIHTVNNWLTRVAFERDAWDERLEVWSKEVDLRIGIFLHLARLFVWLTRKILVGLLHAGNAVSCFASRQMEFDADRYAIQVAGSDGFEGMTRRLPILAAAWNAAVNRVAKLWEEKRLADDFPGLVISTERSMPADVRLKIEKLLDVATTGLFATHPSSFDRIAKARRAGALAMFQVELPGPVLFRDFPALARDASRSYYELFLGDDLGLAEFATTEQMEAERDVEQACQESLGRYLQHRPNLLRSLALPGVVAAPTDLKAAAQALLKARKAMKILAPAYRSALTRFDKADDAILECERAEALVSEGIAPKPTSIGPALKDQSDIDAARAKAHAEQKTLLPMLEDFERAALDRLVHGLALSRTDRFRGKLGQAQVHAEQLEKLLSAATITSRLAPRIVHGRSLAAGFFALIAEAQEARTVEKLKRGIGDRSFALAKWLGEIRGELERTPFVLAGPGGASPEHLAEIAIAQVPSHRDWGAVLESNAELHRRFADHHFRTLGRITRIAEAVEMALGLPLFPDLEEEHASEPR